MAFQVGRFAGLFVPTHLAQLPALSPECVLLAQIPLGQPPSLHPSPPAADEPFHSFPLDATMLAPPFKNVVPEATDREAEVG